MYNDGAEQPTPGLLDEFDPFDDYTLVPQDGEPLYDNVDYSVTLHLEMNNLGDGAN
jgi:iron transport multicopper oxidase